MYIYNNHPYRDYPLQRERIAVREGEGVRDDEWPAGWRFQDSIPWTGDRADATPAWRKRAEPGCALPTEIMRLHF